MSTMQDYEQMVAYLDVLRMEKQRMQDQVIPAEIKQALADIDAEVDPRIEEAEARVAELKALLESEAKFIGDKIEGKNFHVIYYKPSKSIAAKDALHLAASWEAKYPECATQLRSIITMSKERASVQPRKG